MSDPRQRRERLFDLYSRHLAQYDRNAGGVFVCPLCRRQGPRSGLTSNPLLFTLAHVVPQSLGGTTYTLACAECNNGNGASLERYLVEHFKMEDWELGLGSVDARARIDGHGDVGIDLRRGVDGAFEFHVAEGRSNPRHVEATRRFLEGLASRPNPGFTVRFGFRTWEAPRRVDAAVYQSAFLLLFRHFGYEAVLHPHYEPVRDWLGNPDGGGWEPQVLEMPEEGIVNQLEGRQHALLLLRRPRLVAAVLRFLTPAGRPLVLGVILPGLDGPVVPKVSPGEFEYVRVPYYRDALVNGPGWMRVAWGHYESVFSRSPG